jgi:plasmid replication initiation protein
MTPKKQEVKKHVATIHCSNTLSLLQRKISNALLFYAYSELLSRDEHTITIKQLCTLIGYKGNNHAAIKDAMKGLIATVVEWNVIDNVTNDEDWTASSILASVRIKGPICFYAYSPRMKELLYSPAIYGKINLTIQAKFKSNYGLALYENCARYESLSHTKWFNLDIFRRLMGVPDNQYVIFRDFKRRVLNKAIEEVNAHSAIFIIPQFKKELRQIVAIRFDIQPNKNFLNNKLDLKLNDSNGKAIIEKLNQVFGLNQIQVSQVTKQFSMEYIWTKIQLIELSPSYQQGKINNLAKYLLTALKQDYQPAVKPVVAVKNNSPKKLTENENKKSDNNEDFIKKAYAGYLANVYNSALASLDEEEKKLVYSNFSFYLKNKGSDFLQNLYSKKSFQSKFVQMEFRQFIQTEFPHILPTILEYEDFLHKNDEKIHYIE